MSNSYFSGISLRICTELAAAQHSIKVAVAWLTQQALLSELRAAAERGVKVELLVSRSDFNQLAKLYEVANVGAEVLFSGPSDSSQAGFLHHKFCVIDYKTVITGSYNWSANAEKINENILVTHDDQKVAAQYLEEFQQLLADATPLLAETRTASKRSGFLSKLLGQRPSQVLPPAPEDIEQSAKTQAALVRLWATRLLGAPGDETVLHWEAPAGLNLRIFKTSKDPANDQLTAEQDDPLDSVALPSAGQLAVVFGERESTFTLVATTADDDEVARRTVRLLPARLPVIDVLELDRPTIVGRVMPATISWRASHAETVRLVPGPDRDLPVEGELSVSPDASVTYTLTAYGLGGKAKRSISLGVFPVPVMSSLAVPALTGLQTQVQLSYASTPLPSGLDLRESQLRLRLPRLQQLQTELLSNTKPMTLAELAAGRGLASPADLRWPTADDETLAATASRPRWTDWRLLLLNKLEPRFQHNPRLSYLLSTIRKLYA